METNEEIVRLKYEMDELENYVSYLEDKIKEYVQRENVAHSIINELRQKNNEKRQKLYVVASECRDEKECCVYFRYRCSFKNSEDADKYIKEHDDLGNLRILVDFI